MSDTFIPISYFIVGLVAICTICGLIVFILLMKYKREIGNNIALTSELESSEYSRTVLSARLKHAELVATRLGAKPSQLEAPGIACTSTDSL